MVKEVDIIYKNSDSVTLYQGDCLGEMSKISDKSVDMILCDLPYGTTRNKWDSVIPFDKLWENYMRIIKTNGAIVLFAQTPFDKILGCSNIGMLKYEWIWQKNKSTGFLNSKKMPLKAHENILIFYDELPTYNPQGLCLKDTPTVNKGSRGRKLEGAGGTNYGKATKDSIQEYENYPKDILTFNVVPNPIHPTQKPVPLLEYLVRTYTNEGETVLDNCMGSGSTGVACVNTDRKFIGIELDGKYFEIAKNRVTDVSEAKQLNMLDAV
jgi:site-specific DNA-methyltransferase (adenine-specific)